MFNYELKLVDSSRFIADMLVTDIDKNPEKFAEMMELAFRDEYPLSMRAARVITLCTEKEFQLITPYLDKIVEKLQYIQVEGVKRGFLKMLCDMPMEIDEKNLGILTDLSFTWLTDSKEAIAIRYYAMDILSRVVKLYPEIKLELLETLNSLSDIKSSALHSKIKKLRKQLANV